MFVWGAKITSLLAVPDVVPPLVAVHLYSRIRVSLGRRLTLSHPWLQYTLSVSELCLFWPPSDVVSPLVAVHLISLGACLFWPPSDVVSPLVAVPLYQSWSRVSFGRRLTLSHPWLQYNCISLGHAVAAAAAIIEEQEVLGSVLFCLSLNHKQASLPL
jgi:hypothetical protein